ncbi:MAG: hypothetical protein DMG11_08215 [Acidobacteria bacterium]|nr:MAG: hypothetical protein DMG11_08215 [Acidobacteriota bacterium]
MISFAILVSFLTLADFSNFTYCRENSRGLYELQCVQLDANAKGEVKFKRREAETVNVPIQLSQPARDRFLAVLAATNYLDQGETYESNRKVADLGRKRLTLEMPSGKREASFNFSDRREVMELAAFFENLINQETLGFDVDNAIQFDRLSIPKRLDQIENELRANRIADPERLIPLLDKIEADQRVVNYARTRAGKIKKDIQTRKKQSE